MAVYIGGLTLSLLTWMRNAVILPSGNAGAATNTYSPTRVMRLLTRQGVLIEEQGERCLAGIEADQALAPLQAASCTYRIALGPRAGQKVLSLQTVSG